MSSLRPRSFVLFFLLLTLSVASFGQVIFSDDFESNSVGVFPAGWTQTTGSVGYALVTDSPVAFGTRAVRLASGLSTASTISITTAITNDYVYEYYVLIPDTGLVNETIGSVKVENVGMQFALGASTSDGIIYFSNTSDGFAVPTNVYHHVKVEVDYQKNVAQVTVNGGSPKKYPISINTAQNLRLEASSISSVLQKHIVYVDSVSVALQTVDLTPAYVSLSNPADLSTGHGASSAISFSWSSVSQATGYQIQIGTDSTFAGGIAYDDTTLTGTSKSVPLPPLVPATSYFWRMRAKNTIGWGDWSTVRRFRTVDPPDAPLLYGPSDGQSYTSADQIYFYWANPSGSQAIQYQLAEDSLFNVLVVNDSATVNDSYKYVDYPPLEIKKRYYWRVRSLGTAGWGAWSSVFEFTTPQPLGPPTLGAPSNGAINTELTQIYFWWNGVSGATEYWLQIAKDSNFTVLAVNDSAVASTAIYQYFPPLEYNTTYYWRVRTGNVAGWGAYSAWRTLRTKPTPTTTLTFPANGSVESGSTVEVNGSTPYSDAADSFYVQIALDTAFTQIVADSTDDVPYMDFNLNRFAPSTTYYWRMRARNVAGWGPFSTYRSFIIANPPPAPTLSSPAQNAAVTSIPVYFTWNSGAATNIQDYRLQIATDSLFSNIIVDTVADYSGVYAGVHLTMNSRYYWRVRIRTNVGYGPYSVYRSFLTPQRPARPVMLAPVTGTMDVWGNVTIRWRSTIGKDSSHIQISTDTSTAPSRVVGGIKKKTLTGETITSFHYGPTFYNGEAESHIVVGTNLSPGTITIYGEGFDDPLFCSAGQEVFVRVCDFNEAGKSDFSEWTRCNVLRTPGVPTAVAPVPGSSGNQFVYPLFLAEGSFATWGMNLSVQNPETFEIIVNLPMSQDYDSELDRYEAFGPDLQSNTTYLFQYTAYNPVGSTSTPLYTFRTADPAPVLTCVMDILNDQGGFLDVDFLASELDHPFVPGASTSSTSGLVYEYTGWRIHPEWSIPTGYKEDIRKAQKELPENIRDAVLALQGTDLWEPAFRFRAIGEPHYRVTVKTRTDSGKNGTGWEKFIVIAHAASGHQFRSRPDSGYSVDNLAPAPPVGGSAAVSNGQVRITWVANDEADLKEYVVYRSVNPNDPVSSLTPIGRTTEPTYLDASPPNVATAYYYIVARDKNENDGEPAIVQATIVTGVETLAGIPTEFVLGQNYPNPFNPTTTIRFGLPERSTVHVQVINTLGQVVEELVSAELPAGFFQTVWEARVPSGLYFARMVSAPSAAPEKRFSAIKKMVLLR